ncbi:MAG TPA: hypothetical protein VHL98_12535 [Microvirga sp.]|jgi:hypothetical protein|nr:hypothetical protein [Microvirga sp.]
MAVLLWMLFQAGVAGYFLYRETIEAQALGREPEPLPVFILSSLGAIAVAALARGLADLLRSRRASRERPPSPAKSAARRGRKADA